MEVDVELHKKPQLPSAAGGSIADKLRRPDCGPVFAEVGIGGRNAGSYRPPDPHLTGFDVLIEQTWDGRPNEHKPYRVHMQWIFQRIRGKPHKRAVKVTMEGPLFEEPESPDDLPGICSSLFNYEVDSFPVFELFFANDRDQYLEIEVGPHGHWLVLLLNGVRQPFNMGEELELAIENTWTGEGAWKSEFEIPLAYFPPNVTKFNAYAIHGSESERCYDAAYPVTDGTFDSADFHRLQFFKRFDVRKIIPEGFNDGTFNDNLYGNLWERACAAGPKRT